MDYSSDLISLIEVTESEAENGMFDQSISSIEVDDDDELEYVDENNGNNNMRNQVELKNMDRAIRNWRRCIGCKEKENLHHPTESMRRFFCKSKKTFIQKNDRVCDHHSQRRNWDEICLRKSSKFSSKMIDEMLALLLKSPVNPKKNVDIGLTANEFKKVLIELKIPDIPNKIEKKNQEDIELYLERIRNGSTYDQMGKQHNKNRRTIGQCVKNGRKILLSDFVPKWIGYENFNRECLLGHTSELAHILYCNADYSKCVTIWDATYIYTCNTANYSHQRKIYSGQKRRHLFKIMKVVATDGTIIDVFGPFKATINDAAILKIIFEQTAIEKMYDAGDIILVDRGFRDCVDFLRKKKIVVKIPEFIEKGQNGQLSTPQANRSRLVTKLRFIVEAANGRMKNKWHIFGKIIPSILTPNLMSDYKIGAALLNAFGKPTTCDESDFQVIGSRMMNLVDTRNKLRRIIDSKSFKQTKKLYLKPIEPTDLIFPRLNKEQIKLFSLGTYSIRQAISYIADHIKSNGKFTISTMPTGHIWAHFGQICAEENFIKPSFVSAVIKSRFRGIKTHTVYILYDSADFGVQRNFCYLCECQHGQRTVGSCAHVIAVVLYFGYSQYEEYKDPASHLNNFFDAFVQA